MAGVGVYALRCRHTKAKSRRFGKDINLGGEMRTYFMAFALLCIGAVPAAAYDCSQATFNKAKAEATKMFGSGILSKDEGLSVLVLDSFWNMIDYPTKKLMAEHLVCAIAGPGKGLSSLTFRSRRTGKIIAEWEIYKLDIQ